MGILNLFGLVRLNKVSTIITRISMIYYNSLWDRYSSVAPLGLNNFCIFIKRALRKDYELWQTTNAGFLSKRSVFLYES